MVEFGQNDGPILHFDENTNRFYWICGRRSDAPVVSYLLGADSVDTIATAGEGLHRGGMAADDEYIYWTQRRTDWSEQESEEDYIARLAILTY